MRKYLSYAITVLTLLAAGTTAIAQMGNGGGGGGGSKGDSGGERPYGGNIFREEEMRQQLPPEGANEYEMGLRLVQKQQYAAAIVHLETALERRPNDAHILYYLGYSHHMFGQSFSDATRDVEFKIALDYYRRASGLDSHNRLTHEFLGILHMQMHDSAAAADEMKTLEMLCPSGCDERDALAKVLAGKAAPPNATPPQK